MYIIAGITLAAGVGAALTVYNKIDYIRYKYYMITLDVSDEKKEKEKEKKKEKPDDDDFVLL